MCANAWGIGSRNQTFFFEISFESYFTFRGRETQFSPKNLEYLRHQETKVGAFCTQRCPHMGSRTY